MPPQQQDWWAESVFGTSADSRRSAAEELPAEVVQLLEENGVALTDADGVREAKLPPELLNIVRENFSMSTMSAQEAKEHRLQLMEERTASQGTAVENWTSASYNFCEH